MVGVRRCLQMFIWKLNSFAETGDILDILSRTFGIAIELSHRWLLNSWTSEENEKLEVELCMRAF
jgi:hypothetical protein